jgi:hypothetical protein
MPKLRVLKSKGFRYAKRHYAQGEVFEAKDKHAEALTMMKVAEVVNAPTYKTTALKAEATTASQSAQKSDERKAQAQDLESLTKAQLVELAKAKGVEVDQRSRKDDIKAALYKRRDMRAEG